MEWKAMVSACQPASTAEGPSAPKPAAYTTTVSALTTSPAAPSVTPVSGPTQTSVAASMQISKTALPESQSSTGSAESTQATVSSSTFDSPTAPESSTTSAVDSASSPGSSTTLQDVGGIIASALGLSKSSASIADTETSSQEQQTQTVGGGSTSATSALVSIVAQGTINTAAHEFTQGSSVLDSFPAGQSEMATLQLFNDPATSSISDYTALFSLASSGALSAMIGSSGQATVDGTSVVVQADPSGSQSAIFTIERYTYTASILGSGTLIVAQTTLSVGGQAVTLGGRILSAAPSGLVIAGTSTLSFVPAPSSQGSDPTVPTSDSDSRTASSGRQNSASTASVPSSTSAGARSYDWLAQQRIWVWLGVFMAVCSR
ncbi:hypothetical protein LTR56_006026 [Elasticomyces elasticus]|nr:hypothetical protein LTR56_006026 [Elasticomyces elasticus]KAK3669013.1 hypothetical protein LTR22_000092 [Elasticomyces elasticus]KAK4922688.1 hypothetical protein LTR49_010044 [Elasticomyces elasticus]KAK5760943.1 hypothetical protein LTS12_008947 [Elasticomyces elasticus]